MTDIRLKPSVVKFIKTLPPKHQRQVKDYLLKLTDNPQPPDTKPLKGYGPYLRGDSGEYRVIYRYDKRRDCVTVVLVGRRNNDDVYKRFKRII